MILEEQISKDEKIKNEYKRLKSAFKNIPQNKKKCVEKLFDKAAFMGVTLEDLQSVINKDGCVSQYQNGENQFGTKKSPEVDIYNTMIKNYSNVLRDLTNLLPNEEKENIKGDEVLKFIMATPSIVKGKK